MPHGVAFRICCLTQGNVGEVVTPQMNDTARFDLHDDKDVVGVENCRVLGEEIAGP